MADGDKQELDELAKEASIKRARSSSTSIECNGEPATKKAAALETTIAMPRKRFYRQRAHVNPLSTKDYFHPTRPETFVNFIKSFEDYGNKNVNFRMNWSEQFGTSFKGVVRNADIGCGYGGLLFKLSKAFPNEGSIGMEIRNKVSSFLFVFYTLYANLQVSTYVQDKISALRNNEPAYWENICCVKTNAMRFFSHFFAKSQLQRLFFLYPE